MTPGAEPDAPASSPPSPAWPAPAKLNLFLHITGRRADGYHELQTVFQFLGVGDELRFRITRDGRIGRTERLSGIGEDEDLTVRAARALQSRTGCRLGAEITLTKRIPLGGGLGGGSSDAATTLVALNHLWGTGLSQTQLAEIGVTLGADVPVFVRGVAAWAEGIGERLTAVSPPEPWYLVVTPPCAVNTRAMYNDPELPRGTPRVRWEDFLAGRCGNDFEALVRRRHPPVDEALRWAGHHGRARMSGSGASVFVDFAERAAAERAAAGVPAGWRCFVARGLNRSPLHDVQVS